jgi:hypothetical protein
VNLVAKSVLRKFDMKKGDASGEGDSWDESRLQECRNLWSQRALQGCLTVSCLAIMRYGMIVHPNTPFFAAVMIYWVVALRMVSNVSSSSQDTTFKKALVEWDVIGLVNLTPPPIFTLLGVGG